MSMCLSDLLLEAILSCLILLLLMPRHETVVSINRLQYGISTMSIYMYYPYSQLILQSSRVELRAIIH